MFLGRGGGICAHSFPDPTAVPSYTMQQTAGMVDVTETSHVVYMKMIKGRILDEEIAFYEFGA
jgi:hypothetical protein